MVDGRDGQLGRSTILWPMIVCLVASPLRERSPSVLCNWFRRCLNRRLGIEPSHAWLDGFAEHTLRVLPGLNGQGLSNVAWAFAQMGYIPAPEVAGAMLERVRALTPALRPRECARLLWAFAALHRLYCAAVAAQDAGDAKRQHAMTTSDASAAGDATAARSPVRPPDATAAGLLAHAGRDWRRCSGQDYANLLWAAAVLAPPLPAGWLAACSAPVAPAAAGRQSGFGPQELSVSLWALARIAQRAATPDGTIGRESTAAPERGNPASSLLPSPPPSVPPGRQGRRDHGYSQSSTQAPSPPPSQEAAPCNDVPSPAAVAALLRAFEPHAPRAAAASLSNALYAAASLRAAPPQGWLDCVLASAAPQLADCQPRELASIAWSLATLRWVHTGNFTCISLVQDIHCVLQTLPFLRL